MSISKLITILFFSTTLLMSQESTVDEIIDDSYEAQNIPSLVTEKIEKISFSKNIFIITNENEAFSKGDFISLLTNNKLICRALVGKDYQDRSGIKILKLYSKILWNELHRGSEVQVIRGDDSYFKLKKKKKKIEVAKEEPKIQEEEDLYNDTDLLDDDTDTLDENKNRHIKNDNIMAISYGFIEGVDTSSEKTRYDQPNISWAYQIQNNFWIEAGYGQGQIKGFPSDDLVTTYKNMFLKVKYTIKAPFYSYVLPYVGYQSKSASSPDAGNSQGASSSANLEREVELVNQLKENKMIFGATFLKRVVPGWFFRADIGTDIISGGFALEF